MPGVVFFYEDNDKDVWSGRNYDLDAWNYACKVAGDITSAYVVNKTTQTLTTFDADMDFRIFDTLEDALAQTSGVLMYLSCPWNPGNQQSIAGHNHAVDWYLFGPASGWQTPVDGYYLPQGGTGAVHSVHAATAAMFHRYWTLNSGG